MAKKPIKKAAKKATKKVVKKVAKKTAKKVVKKSATKPKPVTKPVKKAKVVAKKVVKKVVKKAVKKNVKVSANPLKVTKKGELKGLPAPKATIKPVVKGRIPEKLAKTSVAPSVKSLLFDESAWNKMSNPQKRIFIVHNSVKFMQHGLKVAKGDYIKSDSLDKSLTKIDSWKRTDLKDMLGNASDVTCCGAGILLYADIMLRGKYEVFKGNKLSNIGLSDIANRLDYFSVDQLKEIESAFEAKWAFSAEDKSSMPCIMFGMKITDDKRRMAAILQNIISNDGDFRP